MSSPVNIEALVKQIVRLKLADAQEVFRLRNQLPPDASADALLKLLTKKDLLTTFQSDRLLKGDSESLVLGDYKLMYKNASGSFARVYRGCRVSDGSMIGIKLLRERWANDADAVKLFQREGELGQKLKHPNIVPIYDVGQQGNHYYLAMEFVEGGNLKDFLRIRGKLSPQETSRYALDMALGLEYAIGMGITHRDLKLTNVLMSSQKDVKLIDFGLATDESFLNRGGNDLAQAVEYSTLERATSAPRNDPRSDLYFLGGILYELLTGQPPYPRTKDKDERKEASRYLHVPRVEKLEPSIPLQLSQVVNQLMSVNLERRYQTASSLVHDLKKIVAEYAGQTQPLAQGSSVKTSKQTTVLCIEARTKYQDILRDYLVKYGYRVLLVSDLERAIQRIRASSPECILMMGDSFGEGAVSAFEQAFKAAGANKTSGVLVLGKHHGQLKPQAVTISPLARVLVQPVVLGDIRNEIKSSLKDRQELANGQSLRPRKS